MWGSLAINSWMGWRTRLEERNEASGKEEDEDDDDDDDDDEMDCETKADAHAAARSWLGAYGWKVQ